MGVLFFYLVMLMPRSLLPRVYVQDPLCIPDRPSIRCQDKDSVYPLPPL